MLYGTNTRVKDNEKARNDALAESNRVYEQAMANNNTIMEKNNTYADEYLKQNSEMLDAQTDLDINKINQQKQKAQSNLDKTQKDINKTYINSTNKYGVEAEQRAMQGISGGAISMKNLTKFETQQKALGEARTNTNQIMQELNNQISQARMENSSKKAGYSLEVAKMKLESQIDNLQRKSNLMVEQLQSKQNLNSTYDDMYMQIINQINAEKDREESKRQFEKQLEYQKKQDKITNDYAKKELAIMSNEEIVNKRNQAIKEANGVYNQIINEQTDLIDSQGTQIDDYMKNSKDTINQDINKNVSELQNASEQAKREQEAEKQAIMKNYTNYTNNVDETTRIGALNS